MGCRRVARRCVSRRARNAGLVSESAPLVRGHHLAKPDADRAVLESDSAVRLRAKRRPAPAEGGPDRSRAHGHGPSRRVPFPLLQPQLHQGERRERLPSLRAPEGGRRDRGDRGAEGLSHSHAGRPRRAGGCVPSHRRVLRLSPSDGRPDAQRDPGQGPLRRQPGRRHGTAQGRPRGRRRRERRGDAGLRPAREPRLPHAVELGQVPEPRPLGPPVGSGRRRQGRPRGVSQDGR